MDLKGKRILVVEDDLHLADELCQDLRRHGAVVLGPAPTPFYALQLLGRRGVDAAILDVRLHGVPVFDLADELARRGTPLIFSSVLGEDTLPERYRHKTLVRKPYDRVCVVHAIAEMASEGVGEVAALGIVEQDAFPEERDRLPDRHQRMMLTICAVVKRGTHNHRADDLPPAFQELADDRMLVVHER